MNRMGFSYYPGCTIRSTSIEYGESIKAVFDTMGIELREIKDWNCCGAAATHSMHRLLSLCLPARNIAIAQGSGAGPLVIPCAGCFNMMKRVEFVLRNDPEKRKEIEDIVGFGYDPSFQLLALIDALTNFIGLDKIREHVTRPLEGLKVACYYGCALVRHPKITQLDDPEDPKMLDRLMEAIGAHPVKWSFKNDCCGADLAITYGDLVRKMVGRIVAMAKEAGAQCLVTSCGLCQANLEMRQEEGLPVFYFTELMGVAFQVEGRDRWWKKHIISPKHLLISAGLS